MSIFWKTNPIALLAYFLLDVTRSVRSHRRQVAALRHLDDRLLQDIGLSRREITRMESGIIGDDRPFAASRNQTIGQPLPR